MRAIGYVRVSTDRQDLSVDAQRAKLEAYAALYDVEIVAIEVDNGQSAKSLDRPGLQRALTRLGTNADGLLVVKLDRLTRSVKDLGALMDTYFKRYALLSVCEQLNTTNAAGRMVANIIASVSQWEREAIGERTAEVLRHKRSRGEKTGGDVPYGFRAVTRDRVRHLVPHAPEQEIIARAKALRGEGKSLRAIGKALWDEGYRPRGKDGWHPTTVRNLLEAREG